MEHQNYSLWNNPFDSVTLSEDQASLRNFIATNDQNPLHENYSVNQNDEINYDRCNSTTIAVEDTEARLLRLILSSPTNTSNTETDYRTRDHDFREQRIDQYSLIENGAPNAIHAQSSSSRSSKIGIELDYLAYMLDRSRNDPDFHHGRQIRSTKTNGLDYNATLGLIESEILSETAQIIYLTNDHLHQLMIDRDGNCFVESLLEICDNSFINHLLVSVTRKEDLFVAVCLDDLGHQALVKLMDRLIQPRQQFTIALAISAHVVSLAKSPHGGHEVLKRCFLSLSRGANELILLQIAQNCLKIVRDPAGCCILKVCIKYAIREIREGIVSKLLQDAENLSRDAYGNYVIQFLIELEGANRIIKELKNNFVELSLNKHGSNVVEKCLSCCQDCADEIIFEIMENDQNLLEVCKNEYGNYVIQTAIFSSKGEVGSLLVRAIKCHNLVLQFHPYGKNVITAIKRIFKKSKSLLF